MLNTREALVVLDRDFLETRGKILEIAAVLDRIDRHPPITPSTPIPGSARFARPSRRWRSRGPGRAETIQLIFSRGLRSGLAKPS